MTNSIIAPGNFALMDPKDLDSTSTSPQNDEQKKLKALIARRQPEYMDNINHWTFVEATYEGGREWFKKNLFRYIKEGNQEFDDRVIRAYRFNHSREVVDLINKYLFKQNIVRSVDAPSFVQAFWKSTTKANLDIDDFARQISKNTSIYGRIGIVVDNTAKDSGATAISKADEKALGIKTYAYIVTPDQMLDYSFDDNGKLQWMLIREVVRDDADPFTSSGLETFRYRLWTKTDWKLYAEKMIGKKKTIELLESGDHNLGVVPVILADHVISDEIYSSNSMIDDIAYLDRAVANYLSNLDAIIQDQTFSQLVMPAQNILPGEDSYTKMVEMGTKRTFLYDGEGGGKPEYLSPDPRQAGMILQAVNKIIGEIYHTVGLAGERTASDNTVGIDNSSGVAKAYDFERVNALLAAKANSLETIEERMVELVELWNGESSESDEESYISYPDNFDTRGLYDEFDIASKLMLVDAPAEIRQEQMKLLTDKLFPQLAKDIRANIDAGIADWPMDPIEEATQLAAINGGTPQSKVTIAGGSAATKPAVKPAKPASERKQGQVGSSKK